MQRASAISPHLKICCRIHGEARLVRVFSHPEIIIQNLDSDFEIRFWIQILNSENEILPAWNKNQYVWNKNHQALLSSCRIRQPAPRFLFSPQDFSSITVDTINCRFSRRDAEIACFAIQKTSLSGIMYGIKINTLY